MQGSIRECVNARFTPFYVKDRVPIERVNEIQGIEKINGFSVPWLTFSRNPAPHKSFLTRRRTGLREKYRRAFANVCLVQKLGRWSARMISSLLSPMLRSKFLTSAYRTPANNSLISTPKWIFHKWECILPGPCLHFKYTDKIDEPV